MGTTAPGVESQNPLLLGDLESVGGGIPLFSIHRDTSSCLPILRTPPPPAGRCLLKALNLELHFFGL